MMDETMKKIDDCMKAIENWKMIDYIEIDDGVGSKQIEFLAHGYEVIVQTADFLPGNTRISVSKPRDNRYAVDVNVYCLIGDDFQSVRIQTSGWGDQSPEDIDKVIEAYRTAQLLAGEIERAFPQCFK